MDKSWKEDLKKKVKAQIDDAVDASNTAVATNLGKKGAHTSVSSRQRVVQRNGKTTRVEERIERSDGGSAHDGGSTRANAQQDVHIDQSNKH